MCHICGREYGSRSLDIHVKQCKKKWEVQESQKPPGDRRPCPSTPKKAVEFNQALSGSKGGAGYAALDTYNQQAFDTYNTKALVPCQNCGRTFLPDSLVKHAKMCKGAGSGSISQMKNNSYGGETAASSSSGGGIMSRRIDA